jgi:predicted lactoylglutathione lyase
MMTKNIFVNLPVKDLKKSMDFYTALGFTNNPQFTDETAACMVISENIYVMLLTYEKFKGFTKKDIADATKTTQVLLCIDAESKEKVIELVNTAKNSGGSTYMEPADHGWMYQHSFADLDGHQWEVAYMDISKFPQQ